MEQYILKSVLVAEINRQQRRLCLLGQSNEVELRKSAAIQNGVYYSLLSFIDTLEVKEVDLDAEWKRYFEHRGEMATVNVKHLAEHFFALGMAVSNKAQKGE